MHDFSEEELAGLSVEEREAIEGPEDLPPGTEGDEGGGEGETGTTEKPGEGEGAGDVASPPGVAEGGGASPEGAASGQEPGGDARPPVGQQTPFVPMYEADTAQLDEIQNKLAAIDQQLTDGDLDLVEYTRLRDPLIQARTKIELTQEFNQQSIQQLWKHEQALFFGQNSQYREDPVMNGALRAVFKTLDTEENAHKSGYELLNEARVIVEQRFNQGGASGASGAKSEQASQAPPRPGTPARAATQLPKTLADTIPADANVTQKDEFAHLDNLTGTEYEKALSALNPDQERRYLRGS